MANYEYDPKTRMYYGYIPADITNIDPDYRLIPAPFINVSREFQYADETIIGYSYNVSLQGTVTATDLREENAPVNGVYKGSFKTGFGNVIEHISKLRKILLQNGGTLVLQDKAKNTLIRATGGRLQSFSIDESTMVNQTSYSASLTFDNVEFLGGDLNSELCDTPIVDSPSKTGGGFVDIKEFKIKSFEDNWNINFDHEGLTENAYVDKTVRNVEGDLGFNNINFQVQYTISATGKDFCIYAKGEQEPKAVPAWQQAKKFCQFRLVKQVQNLIAGVLVGNASSIEQRCTPNGGRENKDIFNTATNAGLLKDLYSTFNVYDEKISCEFSESDGSFSATYTSIIKSSTPGSLFTVPNAYHRFTKSTTSENTNGIPMRSLSIQGQIQGLMPGGLINSPAGLEIPDTGSMFITANNQNKFASALQCFDKIFDSTENNQGLSTLGGKRDLKKEFKELLGVQNYFFDMIGKQNPPNYSIGDEPDLPDPSTFNITYDYHNGSINYNVSYSNNACNKKFRNVSFSSTEPADIIALFDRPGSSQLSTGCPYIQKLGTKSSKTINISIEGLDMSFNGVYNIGSNYNIQSWDQHPIFNCECDSGYLPINLPVTNDSVILTNKTYTHNPLDGSFKIDLSYIVAGGDCSDLICWATNF